MDYIAHMGSWCFKRSFSTFLSKRLLFKQSITTPMEDDKSIMKEERIVFDFTLGFPDK